MSVNYSKICSYLLIYQIVLASANVYDCWDPEKLQKMKFLDTKDSQNDPGLSQFSRLLKCLSKMQGQPVGNFGDLDFRQWENAAKTGQFPPGWNSPNRQHPQWPVGQQPPWQTNDQMPPAWARPGDPSQPVPGAGLDGKWGPQQPNYPPPAMPPPSGQPRPGVHPDDWTKSRDPGIPDQRWPSEVGEDEIRSGRNKNRRKNRKKDRDFDDSDNVGPSMMPEVVERRGPWNDNSNDLFHQQQLPGQDLMIEDEEVSLHRKYGYAIMALSVVVLAVLMVSTIFCCNTSNSTMSQPVTQSVPISQIDNYSIYSYKHGAIPADTLLSTGTLGDSSLRTETLRSTQSHGASPQPQYRVSDINPDFARRFNEANSHHY